MRPFIIAEVSANHNGSIDRALQIVQEAAKAGADAVKFQTFMPENMAIPEYILENGPWEGRGLISLYEEGQTPYEWHEELFGYASQLGLIPLSSPFDSNSVEFLDSIGCQMYKIASFELVDLDLVGQVSRTGKPVIMSTGVSDHHEIRAAVAIARKNGCEDLTLLHCVSSYPTPIEDVNLRTMEALKRFGCKVGISDHTMGTTVSVAATALGAEVIEKHLTLRRVDGGLDSGFSMEPDEFKLLVDDCRTVNKALGKVHFGGKDKSLRRSLYFAGDIEAGTILENHHIKTLRPNLGMSPLKKYHILGKALRENVRENDPITESHLIQY